MIKIYLLPYKDRIYEHTDGMATGSPFSPIVANMESFESTAITTFNLQPRVWYRYVDDTFVVWDHGEQHFQDCQKPINGLHKRIQFTMEKEKNNKIPFLDVLAERKDHSVPTSVYRKPTHRQMSELLITPPSQEQSQNH